jgi:cobyric acid synthase
MDNQVREEIIEWICRPENKELLETLKHIKDATESRDWYDDLKEHEKRSLKKGQIDHEKGGTLTSNEFWKKHGR